MIPMDDMESGFITVGRFPSVVDLALLQALLRDNDIQFLVLDDNTVHVAPHLSAAIGGVRLQVRPGDVERTLGLLADQGIPIDREYEGSPLLDWFEARTRALPWVGRTPVAIRFILLSVPILALVVTGMFFAFMPSLDERLTGTWCVSGITIRGMPMDVRTLHRGFVITTAGCDEYMEVASSGIIRFPGFASPEVNAHWRVLRGDMIVEDSDTLEELLDGTYKLELYGDHLDLRNQDLLIRAERRVFRLPF